LDGYCAPQLLVEKVFALAKDVVLGADGVGNVLDRLRVVQRPYDLSLLGVRLSVRRRMFRIMCPLHACDCALAAGAGG